MRERCLQSLAILLAGLFSAERLRANESSTGLFSLKAVEEPDSDAPARPKLIEH